MSYPVSSFEHALKFARSTRNIETSSSDAFLKRRFDQLFWQPKTVWKPYLDICLFFSCCIKNKSTSIIKDILDTDMNEPIKSSFDSDFKEESFQDSSLPLFHPPIQKTCRFRIARASRQTWEDAFCRILIFRIFYCTMNKLHASVCTTRAFISDSKSYRGHFISRQSDVNKTVLQTANPILQNEAPF